MNIINEVQDETGQKKIQPIILEAKFCFHIYLFYICFICVHIYIT